MVGDLKLDGLRVNQLKLCKQLAGSLALSDRGLHLQARGGRPDEALDLDLAGGILQMPASMGAAPAALPAASEDPQSESGPLAGGFSYGEYELSSSHAARAATRQLAGAATPSRDMPSSICVLSA